MGTPQTVVEQQTAQKTSVGRTILLGLSVSVATFIFFGFNAVMLLGGDEGGSGGGAFMPLAVYDIQTVSTTPRISGIASIKFYSGSRERLLGTYTRGELYRDGSAFPYQEDQPLLLGFRNPFEATNITVVLNNGWTMNFCMPKRSFGTSEVLLQVDSVGNLYTLSGVRLSNVQCSVTSAYALAPLSVDQVTVNEPYTGLPNDAWVDFRRDFIAHMGTFDPRANIYTPESGIPILGSRSPLLIRYWNGNSLEGATFPARNLTLTYSMLAESFTDITQEQKTICLPSATLERRSSLLVPTEKYFYVANDGTLYSDPLLTAQATMTGCPIAPAPGNTTESSKPQIAP
ncbi:MAG: hypothetical protein HY566_03330 [Candidatus Kerfeldbacteria bacterium]|nr:hypothetical protein [Candidatus Kerfeldbacteria bacterium]